MGSESLSHVWSTNLTKVAGYTEASSAIGHRNFPAFACLAHPKDSIITG
jgi:hypothetical protein